VTMESNECQKPDIMRLILRTTTHPLLSSPIPPHHPIPHL
jgi:hypothetical protein